MLRYMPFSALTLLVVRQEEHPACINRVMSCWCGYLSGAMCRLFACGPADATAVPKPHILLPRLNPDWFYLSDTGLPGLSWKRGHGCSVVVRVELQRTPCSLPHCCCTLQHFSVMLELSVGKTKVRRVVGVTEYICC